MFIQSSFRQSLRPDLWENSQIYSGMCTNFRPRDVALMGFFLFYEGVCACLVGGGGSQQQHHDHQWVDCVALSTTWYKTCYPTYAPVADWRYAGIQLLFITPKPGHLICPHRVSLQDLSLPTSPHQGARSLSLLPNHPFNGNQVKTFLKAPFSALSKLLLFALYFYG